MNENFDDFDTQIQSDELEKYFLFQEIASWTEEEYIAAFGYVPFDSFV